MLKIFDLRTGELKINFWGSGHEFATGDNAGISGVSWPVVRWSGINDDIYFSRIEKNVISIYETKTFAPIDGKPLRVENVLDFSWSPVDPILALFVSAHDSASQSSGVTLIKIPSKEELKHKNLFNLSDCKIYWHSEGDYLAVIFKPFPETNTSKYTAFAFFKIKKPGIPIEDFELENKNDNIIAFAWEPKGDRFAIIHGMSQKPDISFYSMRSAQDKAGVSKLITLKGMQANTLFWSPVGRFIVLAGYGGFSGQLNFYDVDALETLATDQFEAKNIEWSPSGRYLATLGSLSTEMGKGIKIWSFCGKLLYQIPRIGVSQKTMVTMACRQWWTTTNWLLEVMAYLEIYGDNGLQATMEDDELAT
ncbi:hypothetical protein L1049_001211 [Liquidambar formosana]|uniref:Translation initiation factor beta propellor-like domain-containing protein n=1 Tax=Liquidambar formosana TaxID=63359 RepID=A0AAP0NC17_LIQFO